MRRQLASQPDHGILVKVEKQFAQFRETRRGARERCSDGLRGLAFAAIAAGHSVEAVSKASCISRSAISRWQSEARESSPILRELKIVPTPGPRPSDVPAESHRAIVRLGLGGQVAIELPLMALTETFLRSLAVAAGGDL
jgi:hypothetical protein